MRQVATLFLLCLLIPLGALAVAVDDAPLPDPELEAQAREIMAGIRCLVCQNQSIEDSNAPLAQDLRQIVREQVAKGAGRAEVEAFLVKRYGDWVLLKPPFNMRTVLLWAFPPALLVVVITALLIAGRRKAQAPKAAAQPLSEEEKRRVQALIGKETDR